MKNILKKLKISKEQAEVWTAYKLDPTSAAYNTAIKYKFAGNLDEERFEKACRLSVEVFPAFRSAFLENSQGVFQMIYSKGEINYIYKDFSNLPSTQAIDLANKLVYEQITEPFNLQKIMAPRFLLIKVNKNEYFFTFVIHHIVSDGDSARNLRFVLSKLYNSALNIQSIQDYVEDVFRETPNENINVVPNTQSLDFWENYVKDKNTELNFSELYDFTLGQKKKKAAAGVSFQKRVKLSENVHENFKKLARNESCTPFIVFSAVLMIFLSRYLNNEHITIGYPISKRKKHEKNDFGFFSTYLPIIAHITANLSLVDVIHLLKDDRKKRKCFLDITANEIIKHLRELKVIDGTQKLCNVLLAEASFSADGLELNNIEVDELNVNFGIIQTDLALCFDYTLQKCILQFDFSKDLFSSNCVEQFSNNFVYFIENLLNECKKPVGSVNLLENQQLNPIVSEKVVYDNTSIAKRIKEVAHKIPEGVALIYKGRSTTYQDLLEQSLQIKQFLDAHKVQRVAIFAERSDLMLVCLVGCLLSETTYIPIDISSPEKRIEFIFNDSEAQLLLTTKDMSVTSLQDISSVYIEDILSGVSTNIVPKANNVSLDSKIMYIIYTSGTTGTPKGVAVSEKSFLTRLEWFNEYIVLQEQECILQSINYAFDPSVYEIFWPLTKGAALVLAEQSKSFDPAYIQGVFSDYNIVFATFIPSLLQPFLEIAEKKNCKSIKNMISGGEKLLQQTVDLFYSKIPEGKLYNIYGPTESTIATTFYECKKGEDNINVPIGKPVNNTKCFVLNKYFVKQPVNVIGELFIGGECLAEGYISNLEEKAAFIENPYEKGKKIYKTGDLVKLLSDGNLQYIARNDEQIKINGRRVEIREIEVAIAKHFPVQQCLVRYNNSKLIAYYTARNEIEELVFKELLKSVLPVHMLPCSFVFLKCFPITSNGKVDVCALPEPECSSINSKKLPISQSCEESLSKTEKILIKIWMEVLKVQAFDINESFFDIGGDSLKALELVLRIESELGVKITGSEVYDFPTIRELAKKLDLKIHISINLQKDIVLPKSFLIQTHNDDLMVSKLKDRAVLVTGGTGLIGKSLIKYLLKYTQHQIFCLIRGNSQDEVLKKAQVAFLNDVANIDNLDIRVKLFKGDLAKPYLGLDQEDYSALEDVDVIYHCGADISFGKGYNQLRQANVEGTKEIITLAARKKPKFLHYFSTGSVFQSVEYSHYPKLNEDTVLKYHKFLINGYAQSKWVGEKIIQKAFSHGLKGCIYRISTVLDTEEYSDVFGKFIQGCLIMRCLPDIDFEFNLVSMDYVLKALHACDKKLDLKGEIIHLINPNYTNIKEVFTYLKSIQPDLEVVPYHTWKKMLLSHVSTRAKNPLSSIACLFHDIAPGTDISIVEMLCKGKFPRTESYKSCKILSSNGVECSKIDQGYFTHLLESVHEELI